MITLELEFCQSDTEFGIGSQVSQCFSFHTIFTQGYQVIKFWKNTKYALFWGPSYPFMSQFNLKYWTFWRPTMCSFVSSLGNDSRTGGLTGMEFRLRSQVSQSLSFQMFLGNLNDKIFLKNLNFGSLFCANMRRKFFLQTLGSIILISDSF